MLSILRFLLMCGFGRFIFVAVDQVNGLMELCDKLPVPGVVTRDFQDREATWLRFPKTDSCYVAAVRGPSGAGPAEDQLAVRGPSGAGLAGDQLAVRGPSGAGPAGDQLERTTRWASLFPTPPVSFLDPTLPYLPVELPVFSHVV